MSLFFGQTTLNHTGTDAGRIFPTDCIELSCSAGNPLGGTFTLSATTISAVPEPATWAMLILGSSASGSWLVAAKTGAERRVIDFVIDPMTSKAAP